jgi:hypothetical protein
MIKLTFCLMRRPEFTRESFQAYWRDHHGPLVASVKDVLRIRRYVQTHSAPEAVSAPFQATRGGPPGYDGVAELWADAAGGRAQVHRPDPLPALVGRGAPGHKLTA